MSWPLLQAGGRLVLLMGAAAMLALVAVALFAEAARASDPPGPCEAGYVVPTPVAVAVTDVPIEVASTNSDYFVLYAKHTLDGVTTDIPVSVTRGEDGTTTLSDNLEPLAADQYRVEKYQVAIPADVDGDCVDDITELDDLGAFNPINSAKKINPINGAVAIGSHAAFRELAFQGVSHESHLDGIAFVKFWIFDPYSDSPEVFFMNTKRMTYHNSFVRVIGYTTEDMADAMAGQLVWHPNVPAPDGTLGSYRFEWGAFAARSFAGTERVYMTLAAAMPVLEDNLYFYPETTPYFSSYWDEREQFDASRIHILLEHQVLADVDYIALNEAEGYGRLRLVEGDDRPSLYDVAIYTSLPNDLPRVAGTITTVPQTPLSHVNLRAIQNGLPNAFIRDVLKEEAIKPLIGKYVYYAVTGEGYTIRAATKGEVDAHHNKLRPQSVQTLQHDLTVTEIASLADVSFDDWTAFGVKAANVAELTKLSLPDGTTPVGYAVPFYFYDQFMKQATVAKETILGKKKAPDEEKITLAAGTTLASAVTQMLAHAYFQSDADIQEEMLDDLRDAIKDATSPKFITDALTAMHAKYPDGQSLRYRSSTNNEDLPSFNGAGLYSSKTQDPDETASDGIDKSIKAVWASLWNYRAFLERDFHRVDHTTVYMGVLVHPNYSDERVNGVAVSYDPITLQDNAYYVNSQVGEDLVTNPEANSLPEQLLLGATGASTVLSRSNLASPESLLMTDAQMRQLRSNLETIHNHFKTLYGVQDGDDYAIEIEFKITAANKLAIKQARPWIFAEPLELTPTVTIALDASQADEGAGLELTVTRAGGVLSTPLTVDLTRSETGAMLANTKPTSVTIPRNQQSITVTVPIDDDQEDEHDSVVTVSIAANSDYVVGTPGSASATVTDDDLTQISVRADAGKVTEGSTVDFTFTRSGSVLGQSLTVPITISETGNRLVGSLPTEVTFDANNATSSVSLTTADDSVVTEASVVTAQVTAGSAYNIDGDGSAQVTVSEDEVEVVEPTLLFAFDHAVNEGKTHVVVMHTKRAGSEGLTYSKAGPDVNAFRLYGSAELLVFNAHDYHPAGDANQDGVYEIDLTAENSGGGVTTARIRFTVTNAELIALAEQQWDQTSADQRKTLLPDENSSRLQPTFANLQTDVKAMALRLARQGHLPSPGPTVSVTDGSGITEGGLATFTVTATPAPTAPLDVTIAVSQDGDFGVSPGSQTVTIPTTGSTQLTVATSDDQVGESDGSVTATVNAGTGYLVSWTAGAATVEVADDDGPPPPTTPEISIVSDGDVTEGTRASFTVTATPAPTAPLDVTITVSQDGDYGVATGSQTVTIPTSGSYTLTVATVNDTVDEADGSVTATVNTGTDYTVSSTTGAATVAVADDDPEISIVSDGDVTEGDNASFTLTASPAPAADLDVTIAVSQSGDYGVTPGSQTVTIPTSGSYTLTVATSDDSVDEADGSVTATVNTGTDYTVSATAGAATVAIADDDDPSPPPTPEVSIAAGSGVTEGASASFTLTANPAPAADLDVTIAVSQSGDFGVTPGSHTVTIPSSGSSTFTVATVNDTVDESDGSVTVTVNTGTGYTVSATAGAATVAIADDDDPSPPPTPEVSIAAGSGVTEGAGASFTLTASPAPTSPLSVTVNVSQSGDFGVATGSQTVTIPTSGSYTLTVATSDDSVDESDGSVTVTVNSGTGYTVSATAGAATVAVADDDDVPQTCDSQVKSAGLERARAAFDWHLSYGTNAPLFWRILNTLGAGNMPNKPSAVTDDTVSAQAVADFSAGKGWAGWAPINEALADCEASTGTGTPDTTDNVVPPPPPTPEVSVSAGSGVTEGNSATFTVSASPAPAADLDVTIAVSQSGDFGVATGSQTVTIPTSGSYTLTVATSDDSLDEADGSVTVTVTVNSDTGYTVSATSGSATVAVSDDDDPSPPPTPEVSIAAGSGVTEGGTASFALTASPAPASPLSVTVNVSQSGDFGVATGSQTVTIPTGGSYTLTVATVNDSVDESDGSVTVTVNSGTGYTVSSSNGAATVAIADDDDPSPPPRPVNATPSLSISDGSATEGGAITFTVTLSPSSSRYVWVTYYAHPAYGTAASATYEDFEMTYGMLTFKPGETSKTITVTLVDDSRQEGTETFVVSLYSEAQARVADRVGTGTIIDND